MIIEKNYQTSHNQWSCFRTSLNGPAFINVMPLEKHTSQKKKVWWITVTIWKWRNTNVWNKDDIYLLFPHQTLTIQNLVLLSWIWCLLSKFTSLNKKYKKIKWFTVIVTKCKKRYTVSIRSWCLSTKYEHYAEK